MPQRLASILLAGSLAACAPETNDVAVQLAPDVISSIDGTLAVRALALADRQPAAGELVHLAVDYKDRNGAAHTIAPVDGETDETGAFEATFTGLTWDGTGTVTATIDGTELTGAATFAVLDRTPPSVSITPLANNQIKLGTDVKIAVKVTDEIGISQVFFESSLGQRDRSTVVASGSTDTTVSFDYKVENVVVGSTVTLYALAADLSGNQAAAKPVTLTVTQ
jgi:hypothetical protein